MNNLKGKIIVVTGGSGFLGKAFLEAIVKEGGIGINGDINCADDLGNGVFNLDITSEISVSRLITEVSNKFGRIDGWVNNAYPRTKDWGLKFEDIPIESWSKNIEMHLGGYFLCCQKVLEFMKAQQSGSLINMSSIYGILGPDFSVYKDTKMTMPAAYAAIKGGLINLSRYLASYYGSSNVRVNCISPGGIWDDQPKPFVKAYNHKVPLGRMGNPEDIAPAVVYLLSEASKYISGHNLVIDGGWSAI